MAGKRVFVTVGTTQFDDLIKAATEKETLDALHDQGYTEVVLQIGSGFHIPAQNHGGVAVSYFRLKPNIAAEFAAADLVISHAGAGSCIEALEAGKPLIAVVNDTLMANHQTELAEELANNKFCYYCYPGTLFDTLVNLDVSQLIPYVPGQPHLVTNYLDSVIKVL